jgi:hypothetical protein
MPIYHWFIAIGILEQVSAAWDIFQDNHAASARDLALQTSCTLVLRTSQLLRGVIIGSDNPRDSARSFNRDKKFNLRTQCSLRLELHARCSLSPDANREGKSWHGLGVILHLWHKQLRCGAWCASS